MEARHQVKTMSFWGVGPKWAGATLAYAVAVTIVSRRYAVLVIPPACSVPVNIAAAVLLVIGVPFYVLAARAMFLGVAAGELITTGPYRVCRHPIYGSWIVFILPGLELLCGSWLGLSSSVVGYALLRFMARTEESYLREKFGERYLPYRRRTPFVLPIGFLKPATRAANDSVAPRSNLDSKSP